jgi:hypothetical protein
VTIDPALGPELAPERSTRLAAIARGRVLAIGFLTSRCCGGVVVGQPTTRWLDAPPPGYVDADGADGVPVVVDARLAPALAPMAPVLRLRGIGPLRRVSPEFGAADRWLDFLSTPAARAAATDVALR